MQRNHFLRATFAALALAAAAPGFAQAQPWPSRPVRMVIPFLRAARSIPSAACSRKSSATRRASPSSSRTGPAATA